MKLIGSRQEDEFRREIEASANQLVMRTNDRSQRLAEALVAIGIDPADVLTFYWIPGQLEDTYDLLEKENAVLRIEVPHEASHKNLPNVERTALADFLREHGKGMTRPDRLRLEVAIDIARQRSSKGSTQ